MITLREKEEVYRERRSKIKHYLINIDDLKVSMFDPSETRIEHIDDKYILDDVTYIVFKIQKNKHLDVNFYFSKKC